MYACHFVVLLFTKGLLLFAAPDKVSVPAGAGAAKPVRVEETKKSAPTVKASDVKESDEARELRELEALMGV